MSTLKTGALRGTSGTADSIQLHASNQSVTFPGNVTCSGTATGFGGGDTNTPGIQVYKSGTISVAHSTHTEMVLDTELWDSASGYNTSTGRWTPQTAGTYFVYFQCSMTNFGNDKCNGIIQLRKNGSDDYTTGYVVTNWVGKLDGEDGITGKVSGIFSLNGSSDYVSPWCYQHNYTDSSANNFSHHAMGGFRIAAAF